MKLTFFTKPDCELCEAAWFVVRKVADQIGAELERVDISATGQEHWYDLYRHDIPVVHLDGREIVRHRVDEKALRARLQEHR